MEIPIKVGEAAALADVLLQELETRPLNDETRTRLAARFGGLELSALQPHTGSLARDPVHSSAWFIAADAVAGGQTLPLLLRIAVSSSHSSAIFPDAVLIGRVRAGGGREALVDAVPFGPADHANIRAFIEHVDSGFQPRPRGAQASIVVSAGTSGNRVAAAFDAFGAILKKTGGNMAMVAYTATAAEGSAADLWHTAAWAALRAGWREGYGVEAQHIHVDASGGIEPAEQAICEAALFSKFRLDVSRLFDYRADHRTRHGWSEPDIERLYGDGVAAELRNWIESEFSRPFDMGAVTHHFAPHELRRLAVKFVPSLLCTERLYDAISHARAHQQAGGGSFDYEPSLLNAETITRVKELTFILHWLKARGRPVQSIVPNLAFEAGRPYPETTEQQLEYLHGKGWDEIAEYTAVVHPGNPHLELAHRVTELATVARHFGANLTVEAITGKQPGILQLIGRATGGRVNIALPLQSAESRAAARQIVSLAENLRS